MGIFGFLKKQFIDVIEWNEDGNGTLAIRFPMQDNEIQNGAQLTVRETQLALFVNEGELADLFSPGRHTLTTKTLPILTNLKNWDKAFQSPFKSDLYFFSTREQVDQRWGTQQPIVLRDKEFGAIRLRANGIYSYRIKSPQVFFKKVSGTREVYSTHDFEGQLRGTIMTSLATFFGSSPVGFVEMAGNQTKFSETLQQALAPAFENYGLELRSFFVQSLSLPEELQAYLDKGAQMRMVGDLRNYSQFQAADSIKDAAQNPGGLASLGAGVGVAAGIGSAMKDAFSTGSSSESKSDVMASLEKLHELHKKGILTDAEFETKKAELLKKI